MEIYVGYLESYYDNCTTEKEEKLAEAKMEVLKERAENDKRILINDDVVYMTEDLSNELGLSKPDTLDLYIQNFDCSDWFSLEDEVEIRKRDCIKLLLDKIEKNDSNVIDRINDEFVKNEVNENFIRELINSQVKYAVLDKIQKLQNFLIENDTKDIYWK